MVVVLKLIDVLLTVSSSAVDIKFGKCLTRARGLLRMLVSTDGRQTLVKQCRRRVGTVGNDRNVQTCPSRYKGYNVRSCHPRLIPLRFICKYYFMQSPNYRTMLDQRFTV